MSDNISRQALLDKFEPWLKVKDYNDGELNMLKAILYEIRFMPSAQPYTIDPDGRLWITVDDIDKVTAVVVDEHKSKFCKQFYEDAQPKRGRWISADAMFGGVPFYCSECGENTLDTVMGKPRWNFCPNCGADMREVTK